MELLDMADRSLADVVFSDQGLDEAEVLMVLDNAKLIDVDQMILDYSYDEDEEE